MSTIELQVADRFPPGTKVGAYPRITDFFVPGQTAAVKQATVGKDGTLKLAGLVEHGPYFLAAVVPVQRPGQAEGKEWRAVAITASNPPPALSLSETNAQAAREADAAAEVASKTSVDLASAPASDETGPQPMPSIHEGARGTEVLSERIEGVKKGTPLASHTVTGEAVVVGDEPPKQEDAKGPQASDTETGVATPVDQPKKRASKKRSSKKSGAKKSAKKRSR